MSGNTGRALEEGPGPQEAEGGDGLRAVGEAVALVSASALVGGGMGMLGGVALGAINPFALGMVGAAGAGVPVLLKAAMGARGPERVPWWRRVFGG